MGGMKSPRTYTAEEKQRAMERALEVGARAASVELGIPAGTLSCWRFQAKKRKGAPAKSESTSKETTAPEVEEAERPVEEPVRSKAARKYTPSQKTEILEYSAQHGDTAASKRFGVSRWSVRDWRRKVGRAAQDLGTSPTSGPDPAGVEARRDKEVLDEWHRHPGLGPSQIKNQLRRKGVRTSVHTVRRVMEEAGCRPPKVRSHPHDERFEAVSTPTGSTTWPR